MAKTSPSKPAICLPLLFLIINLIIFSKIIGSQPSLSSTLFIHFISYMVLGIAFEIPEMLMNIWCLILSAKKTRFERSSVTVRRILSCRYVLTHFIAPCSGITVMASGLYLVHLTGYSFQTGWLFWVLLASTIGLYKGMYQHNLFIRRLYSFSAHLKSEQDSEKLRYAMRSPADHILIFLEMPTYLFNYWAAYTKYPLPNPLRAVIRQADIFFGSEIVMGIFIVACGALLLPVLRHIIRQYSRTQLLMVNR